MAYKNLITIFLILQVLKSNQSPTEITNESNDIKLTEDETKDVSQILLKLQSDPKENSSKINQTELNSLESNQVTKSNQSPTEITNESNDIQLTEEETKDVSQILLKLLSDPKENSSKINQTELNSLESNQTISFTGKLNLTQPENMETAETFYRGGQCCGGGGRYQQRPRHHHHGGGRRGGYQVIPIVFAITVQKGYNRHPNYNPCGGGCGGGHGGQWGKK